MDDRQFLPITESPDDSWGKLNKWDRQTIGILLSLLGFVEIENVKLTALSILILQKNAEQHGPSADRIHATLFPNLKDVDEDNMPEGIRERMDLLQKGGWLD